MALFAVTLTDQTTDVVEGADAYQQEGWGADSEAMARREHLRREIVATERFLRLLDR